MENNIILLIGFGPCVKDDLFLANAVINGQEFQTMAIGMDVVKMFENRTDYIITNHPEDIPIIKSIMEKRGYNPSPIVTPTNAAGTDFILDPPYEGPSGSSAIVGSLWALQQGFKKIILCGCPLSGNAIEGNPYEAFRPGWQYHFNKVKGRVKSMSGWTAELLGKPTLDWVAER